MIFPFKKKTIGKVLGRIEWELELSEKYPYAYLLFYGIVFDKYGRPIGFDQSKLPPRPPCRRPYAE